jgi:hypothetical protein
MGSSPDLAVPDDPATRLTIGGALVILSGLAWAWTVAMAAMPECHVLALGSFVVMWTVMMAAMMFPSVIPVVLAFATFSRSRGESATLAATLFVLGYLVVWGALGVPAHWLLVAVAGLRDANLGWTGISHAQSWPAEQRLAFALDCRVGGRGRGSARRDPASRGLPAGARRSDADRVRPLPADPAQGRVPQPLSGAASLSRPPLA